ncbi:hypothetical protein HZF05_07515 [Sphingomonas sp. CGMCC 1.13654]|uniref:Uncharacterized protein n=1 Tax=Sphingomonas chungangi TaxID=2683589 RepID=A0A838L722_9SPHN|nr:hypothetical protein [Sphingomonas chungangi]MBA2933946.1 hypothetical protein [Sphingomonas chungangi]MVW57073.1 hypothetical protein [Sphingomonas chungangi]
MEVVFSFDPKKLPPRWIAVAAHPQFATAARRLAVNMLALSDQDDRLGAVFKDAGHYVAAISAAYLDATGGLTIPMLKQICAGFGFMSPNRARAIVDFLLHIDYLEPPLQGPDKAAKQIRRNSLPLIRVLQS